MGSPPAFAAIVLLTPDGKLILQLRDDKPGISDPGKLSIFAGRIEEGETPEAAARRELFEETTLQSDALDFLFTYKKDPDRHGAPGICYVYVLKGVDITKMEIHEGQGYRIVDSPEDLTEDNCALISYDILLALWRNTKAG